jgi:CDP-glycerol glycerophosphotransferase
MGAITHPVRFAWRGIALPALAWLVLVPLSLLVPKRRGLVLFIGLRERFLDSVKYVFLEASSDRHTEATPALLAEDGALAARLRGAGLRVVTRGTPAAWWAQLRADVVVADSVAWVRPARFHAMFGSRRVQLWHGCPLKQIERDERALVGPQVPLALRVMHALSGRFAPVDLLLSPSPFFTRLAFARAFRARRIIEDDYPRNDVFRRDDDRFRIGVDETAAAAMRDGRRQGLRLVLYMPTFRDGGGNAVTDGALDPVLLQRHAEAHALLYVVKSHPVDAARLAVPGLSRVIAYGADSDIYPLLREFDLLVTDYSSIFFDFLHADRPVVFFPYDLQRYLARDREMYLDYEATVPGPIVTSQAALQTAIVHELESGGAAHSSSRRRLFELAFARPDGHASARMWAAIQELALR